MCTLMRRAGIGALTLFGLLAGHNAAQAQWGSPYQGGSPFAPAMGSNPYTPLGGGAGINPYMSNPYSPGSSYANPYSSMALSPYNNSYANPAIGPGFTLMGGASMLKAYGQVINDQEKALIQRQKYYQTKLETRKQAFDLEMYIKNNTPTWNQVNEKRMKEKLVRIQTNSSPAEITDGRSLNFLLGDVEKNFNKATIADIPLEADVLKQLNIGPAGANNSLGVLRDGGKLRWPAALVKMLPADVRSDIEAKARVLAQNARNDKAPDLNAAADFQGQIAKAREQLLKKANDFDTDPYQDAKRFLNDLDSARAAVERGTAGAQVKYQTMIAKGDIQNVNQLVAVMVKNGWRFGPALLSDEAAYRALHSALAAYDISLNQQIASGDGN